MQKQRSEDLRLAWSSEEEHKKALVFTNLQSGYLIRKRVYLHFKSTAAAIGAPDARVHDLRHTYTVLSKIAVYFQIPNIVIRCRNRLETVHFKTISVCVAPNGVQRRVFAPKGVWQNKYVLPFRISCP